MPSLFTPAGQDGRAGRDCLQTAWRCRAATFWRWSGRNIMNAGMPNVHAGVPGMARDDGAPCPTIAILIPSTTRRQVLSADAEQQLRAFAHVVEPASDGVSPDE